MPEESLRKKIEWTTIRLHEARESAAFFEAELNRLWGEMEAATSPRRPKVGGSVGPSVRGRGGVEVVQASLPIGGAIKGKEWEKIVAVMKESGSPMKVRDIAQKLGKANHAIRAQLNWLKKQKKATNVEFGTWALTENANKAS